MKNKTATGVTRERIERIRKLLDERSIPRDFVPHLWNEETIRNLEMFVREMYRPYGERLLRAAAKGEDWTKIKRDPNDEKITFKVPPLYFDIVDVDAMRYFYSTRHREQEK